ncbi:glycosyltransferase [Brachyspira murdochii]|uniref:glycosyltransferase n=1 Tax=Brachyspira murdochii TaxID=84378 RepID=UPI003004C589
MVEYKITVITPTYNRADFLPQTIESILNQTYTNFEYYILDDGSTDNTKEVVEPYLKDARVKYLYHKNSGEPETVNRGWSLAKGEYFTQINSDDIVDKTLFEEMIKVLNNNDNAVVAYCDYNIIDDKNKIIETIKSPDWNFLEALSKFACYAAMVGTFIKRTKFSNWNYIRTDKYLHINDLEMYWNMALYGNFVHIPQNLVSWRKHKGQISVNRVDSIYEIADWFKEYFDKPNMPNDVLKIKDTVANNILNYAEYLLESSDLPKTIKNKTKMYLKKKLELIKFTCLQIGDNDLIGNKFNGHNLGIYLRENKIESNHIVNYKESDDEYTYVYNHASNNITESLIKNSLFLDSDILHFHLIHNTNFDIKYLPIITKLKPAVITLHDLYFLGGHCVYHFDCQKWKEHCYDCQYLDKPFVIKNDDTAFQFEIKKKYIQESNLSVIVASKWMEDKVKESPIWKNKKIYRVPFGIDQNIFKPISINDAKKELNISENSITLMFRADKNIYKGLDIIKDTLKKLQYKNKMTIITVGLKGLLKEFSDTFNILEYSWIKDDYQISKLYQACDIFLMPSKQEAFGMMAIEAMSCEKMVLALEGTSLSDVINAPECGIVCKEDEYTDKLQYLINNLDEVKRRGELSLKFAKENYNKDIYVNRIIDVYNNVINEHIVDIEYKPMLEQLNKYYNNKNLNNKFDSDENKKSNKGFTFGIYISSDEKYFIIGIFGIKISIKKKVKND